MTASTSNVIRLYDVRPEMALEHLKRSTGLDFDAMPENLAEHVEKEASSTPPLLTDIVDDAVYSKV